MKPIKTVEEKFKKLDEVAHCLLRPSRYIGSIKPFETEEFVADLATKKVVKKHITYNPGFLKIFDEVITNSADFSKTVDGKHVDTIRVDVDQKKGEISVFDNGGIPVVIHKDVGQYIPEMIFELRAGSNFDDTDDDKEFGSGQNGEGAGLTNIFSTKFVVETCDRKQKFKMIFTDNSQTRSKPDVHDAEPFTKGFTRITYHPDFTALGITSIDEDNLTMLYTRTVQIAATNPHLKVYFNGDRIMTRNFKEFIELFAQADDFDFAVDETPNFRVGVSKSSDGEFEHVSFVNSTWTRVGGTHIMYVGMQIWNAVREHIQKKHKVDVPPAQLRQHIRLYLDARISNPRYNSQTKEDLITEAKDYKTTYAPSEKFIKRIINSSIIQEILDAAAAKAWAEEQKKIRDKQKEIGKADYRRVEKFTDANEKRDRHLCTLFLSEGDSASKSIQSGRGDNARFIGSFPLKGKPLNVREKEISRILGIKPKKNDDPKKKDKPTVIQNILTLMGLQIGVPVTDIKQLNFGKVAFTTDADVDGSHISGLLINLFEKFWPELFTLGVVNIFRTPLIKVFHKKKVLEQFFTEREFREWEKTKGAETKGWEHKYYKGLGTSTAAEFSYYLANIDDYLFRVDIVDQSDIEAIELAFSSDKADERKVWLETGADNFDDLIEEVHG